MPLTRDSMTFKHKKYFIKDFFSVYYKICPMKSNPSLKPSV